MAGERGTTGAQIQRLNLNCSGVPLLTTQVLLGTGQDVEEKPQGAD